jgi:hypothetical protein
MVWPHIRVCTLLPLNKRDFPKTVILKDNILQFLEGYLKGVEVVILDDRS